MTLHLRAMGVTCHMGSHSVTCHPTQVNLHRVTPTMQAGTRFTYPGGTEGWVGLVDLIAPRPGVEPATCRSRVRRRTAAPPVLQLYAVRAAFLATATLLVDDGVDCGRRTASENQLNGYIESGSVATHAAWPWHAALLRDGQFLCSATVVSRRWLLTSARCLLYVLFYAVSSRHFSPAVGELVAKTHRKVRWRRQDFAWGGTRN